MGERMELPPGRRYQEDEAGRVRVVAPGWISSWYTEPDAPALQAWASWETLAGMTRDQLDTYRAAETALDSARADLLGMSARLEEAQASVKDAQDWWRRFGAVMLADAQAGRRWHKEDGRVARRELPDVLIEAHRGRRASK